MIVKGRCRGNGAQLAAYLTNSQDNDRAEFLGAFGVASEDPRRALLEMSLSSELTSRTKNGLYHTQLSPRESEAASMSHEQKLRAVEIMAENLGIEGHKWALFEHEKEGRTHLHLVFERYDHDSRTMWDDNKNYAKHTAAARQMEREFGWQLTHDKTNHLDKNIKGHITDMWIESGNGAEFVQSMHRAGFEVTQGMDKRPYQIVDQYGTVHDLTRQLQGIKQADVSQYLNSIRSELRPTAEASHDRRKVQERDRPEVAEPEQSDNLREMSDSQDLLTAMLDRNKEPEPVAKMGYGFTFNQTLKTPSEMRYDQLIERQQQELNRLHHEYKTARDNIKEMQDGHFNASSFDKDLERLEAKLAQDIVNATDRHELQKQGYLQEAPTLPRQPEEKTQSDNLREMSDSQDLFKAMTERHRQQETNREAKIEQAQEQGRQQTQPEPVRYFDTITGAEITKEHHQKLEKLRERSEQRKRERESRGHKGLEY